MHNCSFKWKLFTHWTLIYLMLLQQKQQQQLQQLAMAATSTYIHTYICKCKYVCVCGLCRFINILSTWLCFMRNYSSATDCYFRRGLFCVCSKGSFLLPISFSLALLHFLIIVFIVFTLSYVCKFLLLLRHFLLIFCNNYLP